MAMIRRIQALNYGCLRHVDLALDQFHVLVGPNASGKSTLFDVVSFLGDMVREGVEVAVEKRTDNFQDLVWGRPSKRPAFELAVEFEIPEDLKQRLPQDKGFEIFRYEARIGELESSVTINTERALLMPKHDTEPRRPSLFPLPMPPVKTILIGGYRRGARSILSKSSEGKDNFSIEVSPQSGKGWAVSISFGSHRSALGNLPESPEKFPVATRVKRMLETQVTRLFLDSRKMRQSSPPVLRRKGFSPDGSNLPWAIANLQVTDPEGYSEWLAHVRTTLPDIESINIVDRPDNRHAHLVSCHASSGASARPTGSVARRVPAGNGGLHFQGAQRGHGARGARPSGVRHARHCRVVALANMPDIPCGPRLALTRMANSEASERA